MLLSYKTAIIVSRQCYRAAIALAFIFLVALLAVPARAGAPTDQVRGTVDKVLSIVGRSQPTSKAELEGCAQFVLRRRV